MTENRWRTRGGHYPFLARACQRVLLCFTYTPTLIKSLSIDYHLVTLGIQGTFTVTFPTLYCHSLLTLSAAAKGMIGG